MKRLLFLLLCSPMFLHAQNEAGIKWTTGLSWEQIKQKAKAENKHIFIDAYATWCAPCKMMDNEVFSLDSVGKFFNEKFIAVKVQMDKTGKDNNSIKKWYADADSLKRQYQVEAYPTYIFINTEGQLTEKREGYKPAGMFLDIAKSAIVPGKKYVDPFAEYYKKIAAYNKGERNYDDYPSMIRDAEKRDTAIAKILKKELSDYIGTLSPKERYTKERIEYWNNYTYLSNTKVFGYFLEDAAAINKVMGRKQYAESFVDRTIQYEIVLPFLKEENKGSAFVMEGSYLAYGGQGTPANAEYRDADWQRLEELIRSRYGRIYGKRNVLKARVEWYTRHFNGNALIEYKLKLLNRFPPDMSDKETVYNLNTPAWEVFLRSNDRTVLKGYAKWMKRAVQVYPTAGNTDTYANLLYKLGHKRKAIRWQEKAVELIPPAAHRLFSEVILRTLEEMKKSMPTNVDKVNWEGINTVRWEGVKFDKVIKVKDINQKPIPGSSISNKRTNDVISIKEGRTGAVISVSLGDTILASAPGYQPREITITKNNFEEASVTLNRIDGNKEL